MNRSVSAWTIGDCVEQLKTCDFECEAGRLENNVGYKRLLEIASEAEHWRQSYWDREAAIDAVNAELAEARERERVYQEVYGTLPDDIESTQRRQEREIAALRAKLADVYKINKIKTDEINLLTQENREQSRKIKELTAAALAAAQQEGE